MAPYTSAPQAPDPFTATRTRMEEMLAHLSAPAMASATAEGLEDYITAAGREVLRQMLQDQLDARAAAEVRVEVVTGSDAVVRPRAERGHRRLLATTLGRVEATRIAYRAPGAANLHPGDAALALPRQVYSYPLQRAVALEVAETPLRRAGAHLERTTGQRLGTRQLMEITCRIAAHIPTFYEQDTPAPTPAVGSEGDRLLVLSCDATGVNMIPSDLREAVRTARAADGPQPPSAQLSSREHTGRRRMATVFAVYDADPVPRTGADVLPATAAERAARTHGPHARGRHMEGSLQRSTAAMVTAMFDHAEQRDPDHRRRWIVLVDGANHQLDCIAREAAARGVHVDTIVDIVHVIEYLWRAAEDLYPGHAARAAWVAEAARTVLDGHSPRVVAALRQHLRTRPEDAKQLPAVARTAAYLQAKEPYLRYHLALAMGWPIATGVIEGSCRFLVKDRLDVTGARWGLTGAEAVLLLRAVIDNGDFERYWHYFTELDHLHTHVVRYQGQLALAA
ncbi:MULTISPECIES: ISKra4 family transposase [unclassified Streptomyces]|uniref:ISKra4 family transposase n=1 Tax=unclassified Streptomyces TaxID=2593676 RepID=UPI002E12B891|nr:MULTISPECIES: ISKra4 family transposase [unclassified Streptomyces]WSJ40834.1 ISKra4 family transposase [Streptomyces sp. NBC_01321]WSP61763.1 ISKra4 family transposase [Streptomyces sp. NBC_01240]